MDAAALRAWWAYRQGLDGALVGVTNREALLCAGWSRSVAGANPYVTLFSRNGATREQIDGDVASVEIHELPSARGCTYVLPREHFALGLAVARGFGESAEIAGAKKFLGVTEEELVRLEEATLAVLQKEALDPKQIKELVGDASRNLGAEGKKRGVTTTLPLALGRMQTDGKIRRVPTDGRLDQQRYKYIAWEPNPVLAQSLSPEEAFVELARLYFRWIGPATLAQFRWFSGLGVKLANDATASLGLVPIEAGSELLILPEQLDDLHAFRVPSEPNYRLVAGLDSLFMLKRDVVSFTSAEDLERQAATGKGLQALGNLQELSSNAIVDRGRIVGLWEYEPSSRSIVWTSFVERSSELKKAVAEMEERITTELGDCRAFSLDSPESRVPNLNALRTLAAQEA